MQVVIGGIGGRLPVRIGTHEPDPPFPDFLPGAAIFLAELLETATHRHPGQAGGLPMRLVMHLAGDQTGELAQDVSTTRPGIDAI